MKNIGPDTKLFITSVWGSVYSVKLSTFGITPRQFSLMSPVGVLTHGQEGWIESLGVPINHAKL